jgi:hypothetical protein
MSESRESSNAYTERVWTVMTNHRTKLSKIINQRTLRKMVYGDLIAATVKGTENEDIDTLLTMHLNRQSAFAAVSGCRDCTA